jgi:hypothetical protein
MPTPEFGWKAYDVSADDGAVRGLEAVAETLIVELPDLTEFQQPHDKAKILLETAAEVEHALLAQYLYAALSLRTEDEDPTKQTALSEWFAEVHRIARQEMGHLMTVQNLLLAMGCRPTLNARTSRRVKTSTRSSCISSRSVNAHSPSTWPPKPPSTRPASMTSSISQPNRQAPW